MSAARGFPGGQLVSDCASQSLSDNIFTPLLCPSLHFPNPFSSLYIYGNLVPKDIAEGIRLLKASHATLKSAVPALPYSAALVAVEAAIACAFRDGRGVAQVRGVYEYCLHIACVLCVCVRAICDARTVYAGLCGVSRLESGGTGSLVSESLFVVYHQSSFCSSTCFVRVCVCVGAVA